MTTTDIELPSDRKPSPAQTAEIAVREQFARFRLVMPSNMDEDRFNNLVVGLVKRDRKLISCFATPSGKASLILAAIECASLGLEPNTPLREASILPRRVKGNDEAQLQVEYRGLIKLARRSGEIANLYAEVVHERDAFEYALGTDPYIKHQPFEGDDDDDDPGKLTHCYAVVEFKDGAKQFVVVPRRVVYKQHRAFSDSWRSDKSRPYSPWTLHEEKMWRKTAVRELEPFLPLTAEAVRALDAAEARTFEMSGDAIVAANYGSQTPDDVIDTTTGEITGPATAELDWDADDPNDPTRDADA